ncbi:hypothetical protein [Actinotalea sp.]|uniref:hypothetical protein n=1 Tax=Actinotalea sp. TaxID=1872145 RepID=UPI0035631BBF
MSDDRNAEGPGGGADEPLDAVDLALLDDLSRILGTIDPVPEGLVDRALFALTLEGLNAEVMALHRQEPALAVRGEPTRVEMRTITFSSDPLTVMISLSEGPTGVRIDGWTAPAERYVVQVYGPDGFVSTESDDDGCFVFPDVAPGPASLVLRRAAGGPVVSTPVLGL